MPRKYDLDEFAASQRVILDQCRQSAADAVQRAMACAGVKHWQSGQTDRYLIWQQWARSLGVGTEEVVFCTVSHYRKKCGLKGPNLGMAIASLTGEKAREVVFKAIGFRSRSTARLVGHAPDLEAYRKFTKGSRWKQGSDRAWRGGTVWSGRPVRIARRREQDAVQREWGYKHTGRVAGVM